MIIGTPLKVLIADHNKSTISSINECNPSFEVEEGNPLAFDIDAIVSPANTKGIMNGGYDAVLRRFFGISIEYLVQQYLEKFKIDVGQAIALKNRASQSPLAHSDAYCKCKRRRVFRS